jgi:hypothetical protein
MGLAGEWFEVTSCWQSFCQSGGPVRPGQLQAALSEIERLGVEGAFSWALANALMTLFNELQKYLIACDQGVEWFIAPPASWLHEHICLLWAGVRRSEISKELYHLLAAQAHPMITHDLALMGIFEGDTVQQDALARLLIKWTAGEEVEVTVQAIEQTVEWQTLVTDTKIAEKSLALWSLVERGFLGMDIAQSWLKWFTSRAEFYQVKQEAGSISKLNSEDMRLWDEELDYEKSLRLYREGRIELLALHKRVMAYLKSWGVLDDLNAEMQRELVDLQIKYALYQPTELLRMKPPKPCA